MSRLLQLLLLNYLLLYAAKADISALSQNLQKTQRKNSSVHKVSVQKNDTVNIPSKGSNKHYSLSGEYPRLATAILWHAPPYRPMAIQLTLQEELFRDLRAVEILVQGAEENYPEIRKANRIVQKQERSIIDPLSRAFFNKLSEITSDFDIVVTGRGKIRSQEEAEELIKNLYNYIYSNYLKYKMKFFINDMRNLNFIEKINLARSKLVTIAGETAVNQVDKIFVGYESP